MAKCGGEKEIKNKKRLRPPASFFTWFAENNEAFSDIVAEVCQSMTRFFQKMMFFLFLSEHMTGIGHILMKFVLFQISCYFLTQLFSHLVTAFKILDTHGVFSKFVLFCSAQWMVGKVALCFSISDIVPQSASSIAKVKVVLSLVGLLKILIWCICSIFGQAHKWLYQNTAAFVFVQWFFTITQNLFCIFFTGTTQFRNVKAKLMYMVVTWAMTRILTVCTISSSPLSSKLSLTQCYFSRL